MVVSGPLRGRGVFPLGRLVDNRVGDLPGLGRALVQYQIEHCFLVDEVALQLVFLFLLDLKLEVFHLGGHVEPEPAVRDSRKGTSFSREGVLNAGLWDCSFSYTLQSKQTYTAICSLDMLLHLNPWLFGILSFSVSDESWLVRSKNYESALLLNASKAIKIRASRTKVVVSITFFIGLLNSNHVLCEVMFWVGRLSLFEYWLAHFI